MNIIQHAHNYIILKNKISVFNQLIGLSKISRKLNYHRRSKFSLLSILSWFMVSIFQQRSLYRAEKTKQFTTRTVRNVLNDARINWQRLTGTKSIFETHFVRDFLNQNQFRGSDKH